MKETAQTADKAKAGSEQAINRLIREYHRDIYKMVYYRTGSEMDAEDITQEIFLKMIKSLKNLRDTSLFKSWLYRIAVNCVADYYRKKKLLSMLVPSRSLFDPEIEPADAAETPSEILLKKDFYKGLYGFSRQLSAKEKEVFLLRFVDQLTVREIAETLKKGESTIKTLLYRGIRKFRENNEFRHLLGGIGDE